VPLEFISGDLFAGGHDVLVNPVNCQGVSGAGLARRFDDLYPEANGLYERACKNHNLQPGGIYAVRVEDVLSITTLIIYLATKDRWQDPSRLEWIKSGLDRLGEFVKPDCKLPTHLDRIEDRPISIGIPALGCGLGGLDWDDVGPLFEALEWPKHERYNIKVYVPHGPQSR
jgi:hypothetical protein